MKRYSPLFLFLFLLLSFYGLNSCNSGGGSSGDSTTTTDPPVKVELKYVAVGEIAASDKMEGVVVISKDGENWHPVKNHGLKGGGDVAYGDGRFVIVSGGAKGSDKSDQFFAVSSDGITWETIQNTGIAAENKISFGGDRFVTSVLQKDGVKVLKSPYTGLEEVIIANGGSNGTLATVYAGGNIKKFLVVGLNGSVLFYNPSDNNLEKKSSKIDKTLGAAIYTGSVFVAVGQGGTIVTSTDGFNWTDRTSTQLNLGRVRLHGIAYNGSSSGNKFVAVGESGTVITSDASDATADSWSKAATEDVIGEDDQFNNVSYLHGKFFIVSGENINGNGKIFTSTDGTTWIERYSDPLVKFGGVAASSEP